jgi:HlyD family secretion protein
MKKLRWLVVVALAAAGAGAFYFGFARSTARGEPAPRAESPLVAAPGVVEPASEERDIAAEATGVLRQVLVDENDEVKAGQILAVIDDAELAARIEGARAQVGLRQAELRRLRNGARSQERKGAAAEVEDAEAQLRFADTDLARNEQLLGRGAVAQASYDAALRTRDSAAARARAARERLALVEAPARTDEVAQAQALIDAAEATLAELEVLRQKTVVRAPIDGVVLRRFKNAGEMVTQQPVTPMFTVGDLSHLRVRAEIDEADIAAIAVGQRVEVRADAYGAQRFGGHVVRVASRLGTKSIRTERPSEKTDTKVLEAMIELDAGVRLPVGLRVDAFVVRDE